MKKLCTALSVCLIVSTFLQVAVLIGLVDLTNRVSRLEKESPQRYAEASARAVPLAEKLTPPVFTKKTWPLIVPPTDFGEPRQFGIETLAYPQYRDNYGLTVEQWHALQQWCRDRLAIDRIASSDVLNHWQSIADGQPPFGLQVHGKKWYEEYNERLKGILDAHDKKREP